VKRRQRLWPAIGPRRSGDELPLDPLGAALHVCSEEQLLRSSRRPASPSGDWVVSDAWTWGRKEYQDMGWPRSPVPAGSCRDGHVAWAGSVPG
jgi:hypothetical protein